LHAEDEVSGCRAALTTCLPGAAYSPRLEKGAVAAVLATVFWAHNRGADLG
jgi:hypothetical protein